MYARSVSLGNLPSVVQLRQVKVAVKSPLPIEKEL